MIKLLPLFVVIAVFLGCKDAKKDTYAAKEIPSKSITKAHPGKKLLKRNCVSCHSVSASEDNRIAPPMIAVKNRYLMDTASKEEFVTAILEWSHNPTKETAKMYGAVKRFGVMPKIPYPDEVIQQIAEYMYANEIEKPTWFDAHYKEAGGKGNRMKQSK